MRTRTGGLSGAAAVPAAAAPWSGRGASQRPAAGGAAAGAAARSAVGAVLGAQAPSSVTASTARQRSRIAFMISPSPLRPRLLGFHRAGDDLDERLLRHLAE